MFEYVVFNIFNDSLKSTAKTSLTFDILDHYLGYNGSAESE